MTAITQIGMVFAPSTPAAMARRFEVANAAKPFCEIDTFTTGQVALLTGVAPRTVSKWFDTGVLKGYRIPLSLDRRIPRHALVEFLIVHGMSHLVPWVVPLSVSRPAAVGVECAVPGTLPAGWSRRSADYATGLLAAASDPAVRLVVVHASVGVPQAREFAAAVRDRRPARTPTLVLVVGADADLRTPAGDWLHGPAAGFDLVVQEPFDPAVLWAAAGEKVAVPS